MESWTHSTRFVLEILPNARVLRVLFNPPAPCAAGDAAFCGWLESTLKVESDATCLVLAGRLLCDLGGTKLAIDVHRAPVFEAGEGGVHVTFGLISSAPAPAVRGKKKAAADTHAPLPTADAFSPLPAARVHGARLEAISCKACAAEGGETELWAPVGGAAETTRAMDLPSEHWQEVLECWVCHSDEHDLQKVPKNGIEAKRDRLYVGETYWYVHREDLAPAVREPWARREPAADAGEGRLQLLCCPRCSAYLGHLDTTFPETSVRLDKHATYLRARREAGPPVRYSLSTSAAICSRLLTLTNAHATTRFNLHRFATATDAALAMRLWVINTDTRLHSSAQLPTRAAASPVLQTLYTTRCDDAFFAANWEDADDLYLHERDFAALQLALDESSACFGAFLKRAAYERFGNMQCGWIPLEDAQVIS